MPAEFQIVSSGYCVVDIATDRVSAAPGGTALNVAEATRTLGLRSAVVGRLGNDAPGRFVKAAIKANGVDVAHLTLERGWTTPVLIQAGTPTSPKWLFHCPHCGIRFAKYRPAPEIAAQEILKQLAPPRVYFFDRASLFTLALADEWRKTGSLIVFEPSGTGQRHLFDRAVAASHIVKYSAERLELAELIPPRTSSAIIETRGADGASLRLANEKSPLSVPGRMATHVADTAGAGDWTTAGMLHSLLRAPEAEWACQVADSAVMLDALDAGQRTGVLACNWVGARPRTWPVPLSPKKVTPKFYCPSHQAGSMLPVQTTGIEP